MRLAPCQFSGFVLVLKSNMDLGFYSSEMYCRTVYMDHHKKYATVGKFSCFKGWAENTTMWDEVATT